MDEKKLNKLYDASLQFGKNWMRPLPELAIKRFPNLTETERDSMCRCVDIARDSINEYVQRHYDYEKGLNIAKEEAVLWIQQKFPWMSKKNISHGISQGLYYAWHG